MCGIIGAIRSKVNEESLDIIKHRGPDSSGWFHDEKVSLGHVRLSIQDTSDLANQPFISKDKKTIIIFNGEIYNHWSIRKEVEKAGVVFRSKSDTETILEGYRMFGNKVFDKLNGIFALCIYDITKEKIIIIRDRFGIKPLYYSFSDSKFNFSSELKALHFKSNKLDYTAISNYIKFLWSPGKRTPSMEIKKILPGEICTVTFNNEKINLDSKFLQIKKFDGSRHCDSEKALIDRLDYYLNQAVKRQLLSDVPIGFFLSGGLDSSLLVAIAKKICPKERLQCFTIDTTKFAKNEGFSNDLFYAKKVAKHLDVNLEIVSSDFDIVKNFDFMIWHLDEPQADPSSLHVFNISKQAAKMGYKVLIGGTGGDDIFSGYRRHQILKYEKIISKLPQPVLNFIAKLNNLFSYSSPFNRRLKKILLTFGKPKKDRLYTYFDWLDWDIVKNLFTKELQNSLNTEDEYSFFRSCLEDIPKETDLLNKMLHLEMNSFLVDHNLNYTDKMGMAAGVEIRVPFLDNDLVDFSLQIPPDLKLNKNCTKYILKKVAERYLPKDIIYRSKSGFGAPVRKWINNDLSNLIETRLSKNNLKKYKIFDYDKVSNLVLKNRRNEIDASYSIWAILAIDSWCRQFLNK